MLKHEYVVQLPQAQGNKTLPQSDLHILDAETFLVLARDAKGYGDEDPASSYKQIDLFSIKGATNIA